ncbi:hypothetical protein AL538_15580 [Vibrio harveyi]|jgi:hypothetical protein|uniref:Uncharacterized protein n=1 Tax=Vibrio harveyi TaxID=669 RepID=A0ABM5Y0C4_VIBHA|nr:hypothetical protein AL538_15580 [Vibrio harveyi]ODM50834.1 hypothetical protein BC455_09825 [Vibrio harveyi]PNM40769.1 hypothetical protein AL469_011590 [Vibrio harveyi]RCR58226.1 hypothetical protein DTW68_25265 [Vibrio harveyi]
MDYKGTYFEKSRLDTSFRMLLFRCLMDKNLSYLASNTVYQKKNDTDHLLTKTLKNITKP